MRNSRVLIVGAGALGTASAEMLVRAGVGHLTIVDRDYVEWSNLQRQQLYTEADAEAGAPKATAAAKRLSALNSDVTLEPFILDFLDFSTEASIEDFDLILDATDNFETRLYMNDLAQKHRIPWIYGGATGSVGMTYTFLPEETPCLSCMMKMLPDSEDTCDTVGVIAPIIQWVTAHQAAEAMKWLSGNRQHMRKTLLVNDIWTNQQTAMDPALMKNEHCPSCGTNRTYPYLQENREDRATVLCGRDTIQIRPPQGVSLDRKQVEERLRRAAQSMQANEFLIHAYLDDKRRLVVFPDGRVLFHGMTHPSEAQSVYDRYIR